MEPIDDERLSQLKRLRNSYCVDLLCTNCLTGELATELLAARTTIADLTQSLSQREKLLDELSAKEDARLKMIADLTEKHAACEKALSQAVADAEQTLADWKKERETMTQALNWCESFIEAEQMAREDQLGKRDLLVVNAAEVLGAVRYALGKVM